MKTIHMNTSVTSDTNKDKKKMDKLFPDNASENLVDFCAALAPYGERSLSAVQLRRDGYAAADSNANNMISLAETELFIQFALKKLYPKERSAFLFQNFRFSYIYAFNNAKGLHSGDKDILPGAKTATEDDYVSFSEFRIFTLYLRIYAVMFDLFTNIDGGSVGITDDDDQRIDRGEFRRWFKRTGGGPRFKAFEGVDTMEEAENLFSRLDFNSTGKVLFSEWCRYIKKIEIAENTFLGKVLNGDIKLTKIRRYIKEIEIAENTFIGKVLNGDIKPTKIPLKARPPWQASYSNDTKQQQQQVMLTYNNTKRQQHVRPIPSRERKVAPLKKVTNNVEIFIPRSVHNALLDKVSTMEKDIVSLTSCVEFLAVKVDTLQKRDVVNGAGEEKEFDLYKDVNYFCNPGSILA